MDPENETFIWNRWINLRAVDGMAVYQKNVPWFQLISFSFYMISSLAGDEDNYLVKIMIMVGKFSLGLILDVKKPEILILDDSASALDFATDAALRKAIREMKERPTVFIVTQRASSLLYADEIVVLDDGAIAGIGTHEELLKNCEVYQEIYYSQFEKEEKRDA